MRGPPQRESKGSSKGPGASFTKDLKALPAQRTPGTAGLGSPLQSQDAGGVELVGGGFYDHATRCCGEAFYKIKDKSLIHVVL